jgi:hypothetical protein
MLGDTHMIQSAKEFVELRKSQDREMYTRATQDSAPEEVWLEVIASYPDMKPWVVHNKTVPNRLLELLASDSDPVVRAAVARKRKVGISILERLASDPDESVRLAVVFNNKTPVSLLRILEKDKWERIAQVAKDKLKEFENSCNSCSSEDD